MANIFESEISRSFRAFGWHGKKLVVFKHEEYYDFWMLVGGIHYGLEAKSTTIFESLPFSRLEEHQEKGLLDCEKDGGVGYVLLSFRKTKTKKSQLVAYAIRISDWVRLHTDIYKDRKSIPTTAYVDHPDIFIKIPSIRLDTNKQLIWDLRVLLPTGSPQSTGGYTCPKPLRPRKKSATASDPSATMWPSSSSRKRGRRRRKAASS